MDPATDDFSGWEAQLSPDVLFRELSGEAVLLDLKSQRYFGLDEVGTRIWQLLSEQRGTDVLLCTMADEFEVDDEQLRQDLASFVRELAEAGLIELRFSAAV